ncbi:MAG: hypothetical protein ACI8Q1_000797 [Parvicella sp.]
MDTDSSIEKSPFSLSTIFRFSISLYIHYQH